MITGQLVSVAVMYAVVNLLYGGAVIAIANVLTYVSYGLPYMEFVRKISVTWFAPNVAASQSCRISSWHEESRG